MLNLYALEERLRNKHKQTNEQTNKQTHKRTNKHACKHFLGLVGGIHCSLFIRRFRRRSEWSPTCLLPVSPTLRPCKHRVALNREELAGDDQAKRKPRRDRSAAGGRSGVGVVKSEAKGERNRHYIYYGWRLGSLRVFCVVCCQP